MADKFSLLEVKDKTTVKRFLNFPTTIYKDDNNWIRPLDKDIEKIFDPDKNKLFRKGKAIRWILLNENNKVVGRIAAFYNSNSANKNDQPTGGCGFFDCINNKQAAFILFDAAKQWLTNEGMEVMEGPVNFGTRDNFWGCLANGFFEPVYNMPYNYKYYNELFENYGFRNYYNQYTFYVPLIVGNRAKIMIEKANRLKQNIKYTFSFYDKKKLDKHSSDFRKIFNAAWAKFPGVSALREDQAKAIFKSMKQVLDPRLIIFCYYDHKPIAFFIMIPDLNQIIRKFNGKFHFINKLRLLYYLKIRKVTTRAIGMIFGVIPEFHGKGVAAGMIDFFEKEIKNGINYTDLEMNWIGEFNPGMIKLMGQINAKLRKTHITYRYLFDRNKEFTRAKVV